MRPFNGIHCGVKRLDKDTNAGTPLPVEAAAAGDEEAFAVIVHRMMPMIRAQLHSFTPAEADREDLLQESLLGLLSAVRSYRPDGGASFQTYAFTCIRHRLISLLRRSGVRSQVEQPLEEDTQATTDADDADPASRIVAQEAADGLHRQLQQRLTPLEYEVLLARLDGRSYEEIAAGLGVSKKAVDNAVQRLRRKMSGRK